ATAGDAFDELVVILRLIQAGTKPPAGKLGDLNLVLLASGSDCLDVFVFPGPELDSLKAKPGRLIDPFEERNPPPPHLEIDGETRMGSAAQARHVFFALLRLRLLLLRGCLDNPGRGGEGSRGFDEMAALLVHRFLRRCGLPLSARRYAASRAQF